MASNVVSFDRAPPCKINRLQWNERLEISGSVTLFEISKFEMIHLMEYIEIRLSQGRPYTRALSREKGYLWLMQITP